MHWREVRSVELSVAANTAATATTALITRVNTFSGNEGNGLSLNANGGTLNFSPPAVQPKITKLLFGVPNGNFGIQDNTFKSNILDGLHLSATNNSITSFTITNNTFGDSGDAVVNKTFGILPTSTSANQRFGIGLIADSGSTTINIGAATTTNLDGTTNTFGNSFFASNTSTVTPGDAIHIAVVVRACSLTTLRTTSCRAPLHRQRTTGRRQVYVYLGRNRCGPIQSAQSIHDDRCRSRSDNYWDDVGPDIFGFSVCRNQRPERQRHLVFVQPPAGDNKLASVNGFNVQSGQVPLTLTGGQAASIGKRYESRSPCEWTIHEAGFQRSELYDRYDFYRDNFIRWSPRKRHSGPFATAAQMDNSTAAWSRLVIIERREQLSLVASRRQMSRHPLTAGYGTGNDGIPRHLVR